MYNQAASRQSVTNGTDQYSAAMPMGATNTVRASITVYNLGGATSLTVTIQSSVDLQNWKDETADTGFVVGTGWTAARAISMAYVRLKFTVVGTGTLVCAADVYSSQQ
jgi:hypothetical protein